MCKKNFLIKVFFVIAIIGAFISFSNNGLFAKEYANCNIIYESNGILLSEKEFHKVINDDDPISVFLEFNYQHYDKNISDYEYKTISQSEKILSSHRSALKNYYHLRNIKIVEEIGDKLLEKFYISQYSNYAQYNFENAKTYKKYHNRLHKLANESTIKKLYISQTIKDYDLNVVNSGNKDLSLYYFDQAKQDIGINSTPYTGAGINVGIYEPGILNINTAHFYGRNLVYEASSNQSNPIYRNHAQVVSVIAVGNDGIANGSNIFAKGSELDETDTYLEEIEWFVDRNVDIINVSFRMSSQTKNYTIYDALIDYYSYKCGIVFIIAAGNQGEGGVVSPANAYSAITVGAIDANKDVADFSSYESDTGKPNIVAPGANLVISNDPNDYHSGTSFAAPMVTGIVALLMEEFPYLRGHPDKILTVLTVSAEKLPSQDIAYDARVGVGLVNYQNARKIIKQGFDSFEINESNVYGEVVFQKSFLIPQGSTLKISMAVSIEIESQEFESSQFPIDYTLLNIELGGAISPLEELRNNLNLYYLEYTNEWDSLQKCTLYVRMYSNKLNDYPEVWNMVYSIDTKLKDEFQIHCRSEEIEKTTTYEANENIIYMMNVMCNETVIINAYSSNIDDIKIYDSNCNQITANLYDYGDWVFTNAYFTKGKYYILIKMNELCENGSFNIKFRMHTNGIPNIVLDTNIDVEPHLHDGENIFNYTPSKTDLYEISINIDMKQPFIYQEGIIRVQDINNNVIKKINIIDNFTYNAINNHGIYKFNVYLEKNKTYQIVITYSSLDFTSFTLRVNRVNESIALENKIQTENYAIQNGDRFKILDITKKGEYKITFRCTNVEDPIYFIIFEKNESGISIKDKKQINRDSDVFEKYYTIDNEVNYIIGFFTNGRGGYATLTIERIIDGSFVIVPDPYWATIDLVGSEVTLNNGIREGTTITQGYTRHMFLEDFAPDKSRLAYYWYSSNENVLKVTAYGTVTATGVGTAEITAVYKLNTSIEANIMFTVIPDDSHETHYVKLTTDIREDPTPSGTEVTSGLGRPRENTIHIGYTRFICFDNDALGGSGSPTNVIQDYYWSSSNTNIATISAFGTIKGISRGTVTITGVYKYNPNFVAEFVIIVI